MLDTNRSKSNALNYSIGIVPSEYPDIKQDFALLDAMLQEGVVNPVAAIEAARIMMEQLGMDAAGIALVSRILPE